MAATKANASEIAVLTSWAADELGTARGHLTAALALAEKDYDHNADKIADLLGAVRLLAGLTAQEHYTWRDYERNRTA